MSGTLLGRYWLDREIAHGGMARVHIGRLLGPVGFGRTVAIKRLHEHMLRDEQFVTMFVDEARLATRIQHPNVVQILDIVADREELFLVMEYVHGETLSRLLAVARPAPSVGVAIVLGLLEGLEAAHGARSERGEPLGIIHRDVSPQNVIVGVDGVTRVADFGIAKAEKRLLTTGDALSARGKVPYMAPEQLLGGDIDQRADIWAAAALLWETLTGERVIKATLPAKMMNAVLTDAIPAPSSVDPTLAPFDPVLAKGLERDLAQRYPSARAFAEALESVRAPASRREVAEWVDRTASAALAERRAWVADMELATPTVGPSVRTQVAALTAARPDSLAERGETVEELDVPAARSKPLPRQAELETLPVGGRSALPSTTTERPPPPAPARRTRSALTAALALALAGFLGIAIFAARRTAAVSANVGAAAETARIAAPVAMPAGSAQPPGPAPEASAAQPDPERAPALPTSARPARPARLARPVLGKSASVPVVAPAPAPAPDDSVHLELRR